MPRTSQRKPKRGYLVFVSHAGTDTWVARQISTAIQARGGKFFLDEAHIGVGEDFEERILQALDRADELLVLLTPWSMKRPYVWAEIGAAWGRRKPIVAILYGLSPGDLAGQAGVPVFIKGRNLIELNELDSYLGQLQKRITAKRKKGG